jgi:hypothetical protein
MREDLIQRLASLGYTAQESDSWLLDFSLKKAENYIRNFCNILEVPEGFYQVWTDIAASKFLPAK